MTKRARSRQTPPSRPARTRVRQVEEDIAESPDDAEEGDVEEDGDPPESVAFPGLETLSGEAEQRFGHGYLNRASLSMRGDTYIETGVLPLDLALMGGVPENRVTTLVGWEGSGKTTVATRIAAAAQRKYPDKAVAWIDAEHTFDLDWATKHGADLDRLFLSEPPKAEMVVDIMQGLMQTSEVSLIVLDSLPALVPQTTGDSSAFDAQVADRARLIGKLCSKVLQGIADAKAENRKLTVIFINQWRSVIGGVPGRGPSKTMPGGNQPRYLASCIIDLSKQEKAGEAEDESMSLVLHNTHSFKIVKSKIGNSLKTGEWDMVRDPSNEMGEGAIDDFLFTMTYAKRLEVWTGGGTKQHFTPECGISRNFAKRDDAIAYLQANPDDYLRVRREVIRIWRERSNLPPIPADNYLLGYV